MIVTIQADSPTIDRERVFRHYKYAIAECAPLKLSTGKYLHVYKVTPYTMEENIYGDSDAEQDDMANSQM